MTDWQRGGKDEREKTKWADDREKVVVDAVEGRRIRETLLRPMKDVVIFTWFGHASSISYYVG